MRTDLTPNFTTELTRQGRAPVQLLAFHFPTAGVVRVSDRDLGPADGLADNWAGLVENWGALEDITATDPAEVTIEARQMAVTLINRGATPFSDYFLKEDPEGVEVDLYQWFLGLTDADKTLIDRFVVADPITFSERGRLVTLDLVSAVVNMETTAGGLLSSAAWPNALADHVGRPIDLCFGNCGRVPLLCARTAPAATLNGSILSNTLTIAVHEDLDALGFSAAGTIQIEEELIRYGSRSAGAFNVIQRGYTTTATEHLDRVEVIEWINDHTYIAGAGPVAAISGVQIGDYPAPVGIYSVQPALNPARVIFTEKPYAYRFSAGSTFLAMQFDSINADNTAYQAYKAYDAADDATAARIDQTHRKLSLKQATVNPDRGEIVKAYLAVEHWASNPIVSDYAEVWVEGVGVVGRLSRPNTEEGIDITADVDIDHGHAHALGSEHTHSFYDPILQTDESAHTHISNVGGSVTTCQPTAGSGLNFTLSADVPKGEKGEKYRVWFDGTKAAHQNGLLKFKWHGGADLSVSVVTYPYYRMVAEGAVSTNQGAKSSSSQNWFVSFQAWGSGVGRATATVYEISMDVTRDTDIAPALTGASTSVARSGSNAAVASDKKAADVLDLATQNVGINITDKQASTKSHVNLFDLTTAVNFAWAWFTDRDVTVTYQGSTDDQAVYILHAFFDVEYRKRERFFSDDITAEVAGLVDDGAGTITGAAAAAITRPDHVMKYLLSICGGLAAEKFDTATYTTAGARLDAKGYTIDGKIAGDVTVKDAVKKVCYQARCRPAWNGGLSKLCFVEALEDWPVGTILASTDYQLNSIAVERQAATLIVNQIDLFFDKDWTSDDDGPAGYNQSAAAVDNNSTARFGARSNPERFKFDLVNDAAMAADLAGFYVTRYSTPSSYYSLNAYLAGFGLEKEDKISLSAPFHRLNKAKMRVLGASRVFGSGKNRSINHVALLLECLRYTLIEHTLTDTIRALDALAVEKVLVGERGESIDLTDVLTTAAGAGFAETILITDVLTVAQLFDHEELLEITVADAVAHRPGVGLADTVNILDDCEGWRQFGFGGGQFGTVGFGGWITWFNRSPDEVVLFDLLSVELTPAEIAESIILSDALYLHNGYGGTIGTGWGLCPFGK